LRLARRHVHGDRHRAVAAVVAFEVVPGFSVSIT
jgi:hypothetical protein